MTKVFFHAQPKNALWLRFGASRIQKVAAVTPHSYYTKQQPVCVCVCECLYIATGSNKKAIPFAIICKCSYLHFSLMKATF